MNITPVINLIILHAKNDNYVFQLELPLDILQPYIYHTENNRHERLIVFITWYINIYVSVKSVNIIDICITCILCPWKWVFREKNFAGFSVLGNISNFSSSFSHLAQVLLTFVIIKKIFRASLSSNTSKANPSRYHLSRSWNLTSAKCFRSPAVQLCSPRDRFYGRIAITLPFPFPLPVMLW